MSDETSGAMIDDGSYEAAPVVEEAPPEVATPPDAPVVDDVPVVPAEAPAEPAPEPVEIRDHRDWRPGDYRHPESAEIDGLMQLTGNTHYFDGSGNRLK